MTPPLVECVVQPRRTPRSAQIQVVVSAGLEGGLLGWEAALALRELGGGVSGISGREGVEALELGVAAQT